MRLPSRTNSTDMQSDNEYFQIAASEETEGETSSAVSADVGSVDCMQFTQLLAFVMYQGALIRDPEQFMFRFRLLGYIDH